MIRLLFEQSGTFKNCLKELKYDAIDIDLENQFGETDQVVDIFKIIDENNLDYLIPPKETQLVMSFFPCVRFSTQFNLVVNCSNYGMQSWELLKKIKYSREREREEYEL